MSDEISLVSYLRQLYAEGWETILRENPLYATSCGDHRFNDRLPEISLAAADRRAAWARRFRQNLAALQDSVPGEEAVNFAIFDRLLENEILMHEYGLFLIPLSKMGGYYNEMLDIVHVTPFNTVEDYEVYLKRLQAYPAFHAGYIELMREGIRRGIVPPRVTLMGIEDGIRALIMEDVTAHPLFAPFARLPEGIPTTLAASAKTALAGGIVPAMRELLDFVVTEYQPAARESIGINALPQGDEIYRYAIRYHVTLPLTAGEIHQTGLAEVSRIRTEMQDIIRQVGFNGSFQEFIEFLRTDPRFYVDSPQALLEKVALVLKRMDGELPRLFGRLPRTPYGIREVPAHLAPRTTTAYYFPLAGDFSTAGFYYVNTYDLKSRPLYEIEALSLHEAVPGHHLQIALQTEMEGLPAFRRFAWVTAHGEGWALYAERLGLETGFYTDPYSDFGRLTYEMWRACRLVVDTGIHALGWTRQQAIDFMAANSALTLLNITNEVDRYIGWPGQALAYKLGELKFRQLRQQCEQALGAKFDRRAFHDLVLEEGTIPLTVLEAKVNRWIEKRLTS